MIGVVFFLFLFSLFSIIFLLIRSYFKKIDKILAEREERNKKIAILTEQKTKENLPKKDAYFAWLNENYSPCKIIDFPFYDFYLKDWEDYEAEIIAIDENKKVIIFGRKEISFSDITDCKLITETSQTTTSTTANSNLYSKTNINTNVKSIKIYIANILSPEITYHYYNNDISRIENIYSTMLAIIAISKK